MGSYDGAESCELVGAYLLHKIKEKFGSTCDFGLYRDDGLWISRSSMKSFQKIMCSTRSLTRTQSKSATVACPTSSRQSIVATKQSYRRPADCPMAGNCLRSSVLYQATVTTEDSKPDQTYVGLTETSFKTRFANHKSSFNNPSKRLSTELSKHVWHLKEAKLKFGITWKILKQTPPFSPVSNRCNLCLGEKCFIICRPELATLNKRNELVTSCRQANKFLLKNFKRTITMC